MTTHPKPAFDPNGPMPGTEGLPLWAVLLCAVVIIGVFGWLIVSLVRG